uniref:Hypothetical chloroplast RF20 n=1 Tax=Lobosphaera incisa TaxID=312850 RepID=A0A097KM66_9CHLO|nr:hypothetical chloroplast RF20 [Lobosphaera incisa]AIT94279.1 hypothetical chloroplast RF20 [Lobosphaera incisa]
MNIETKFFRFFNNFFYKTNSKFLVFQNNFGITIFFLFIGFLSGNLFGTILNGIRYYMSWDGYIGLILLFFIESINFIFYHNKNRKFFFFFRFSVKISKNNLLRSLNFFKIGFMFGLFIDAFKVGS